VKTTRTTADRDTAECVLLLEMSNMIVTMTADDLAALIREEVTKVVRDYVKPPKPEVPEKLSINEAVEFLCDNGFKTSKSFVQKLCSQSKIPFYKICGKCIFERRELLAFIENRSVRKGV